MTGNTELRENERLEKCKKNKKPSEGGNGSVNKSAMEKEGRKNQRRS